MLDSIQPSPSSDGVKLVPDQGNVQNDSNRSTPPENALLDALDYLEVEEDDEDDDINGGDGNDEDDEEDEDVDEEKDVQDKEMSMDDIVDYEFSPRLFPKLDCVSGSESSSDTSSDMSLDTWERRYSPS